MFIARNNVHERINLINTFYQKLIKIYVTYDFGFTIIGSGGGGGGIGILPSSEAYEVITPFSSVASLSQDMKTPPSSIKVANKTIFFIFLVIKVRSLIQLLIRRYLTLKTNIGKHKLLYAWKILFIFSEYYFGNLGLGKCYPICVSRASSSAKSLSQPMPNKLPIL